MSDRHVAYAIFICDPFFFSFSSIDDAEESESIRVGKYAQRRTLIAAHQSRSDRRWRSLFSVIHVYMKKLYFTVNISSPI